MADTRRATGINWRLGFTGEPIQSKTSLAACQGTPELAPVAVPLIHEWLKLELQIPLDGREFFLPPLDPRRVYQITFDGTFAYGSRQSSTKADALYYADDIGNFSRAHDWLKFNGYCPFKHHRGYGEDWGTHGFGDREKHRYGFRFDATPKKISVRFDISTNWWDPRPPRTYGCITLTIELLPEGTESPNVLDIVRHEQARKRDVEEEQASRERKIEEENAALKAKLDKERTALKNKISALACRAHRESNFLDAGFQQRYAERKRERILSTLQAEWGREYDDLMKDPQFQQMAREEAPQVLQWLEARVNIVLLAEQMSAPPPPVPPPPRPLALPPPSQPKKLTAEQIRTRVLRRDEVKADDAIERAKVKARKLLKAKEELDAIPLDPDYKELLETELNQKILDIGEEDQDGKDRTTL
jgi:hypothetical protein